MGDVLQLQFYLGVLGVEWGCLDYVDRGVLVGGRGGCVDVSFRVRRDRGVFEGLVHRAILLESYLGVGEVPVGERCWLCRILCVSGRVSGGLSLVFILRARR